MQNSLKWAELPAAARLQLLEMFRSATATPAQLIKAARSMEMPEEARKEGFSLYFKGRYMGAPLTEQEGRRLCHGFYIRRRAARMTRREAIPVIFRVWKGKNSGLLALFPTLDANGDGLLCDSCGADDGHGAANYWVCIAGTRPATPEEYAAFKKSLESAPYKYKLKVYKRGAQWMHDARRKMAREWRARYENA